MTLVLGKLRAKKYIYISVLREGECRCVRLVERIKLIQKTQLSFVIKTILIVNVTYFNPFVSSLGGENAGRNHSVRINNSTFERVEEFKYVGTTLTHQNSIPEEIKSRLRFGNACYHSVQNLLSSRLLSKNLKIKIYRTIILPVVLYGCET